MRTDIIEFIFKIAKSRNAFDQLEEYLSSFDKEMLCENLIQCGVLPEMFEHDSSEEKLWAKFSDIMLSKALNHLGIKSEVLGARGNSADVFGKTKGYTIVGDAKTFRLSRTAKNQKDFKVNALDSWRKGNNYAMLVAPLMQYPAKKSQIYEQAIEKNVTLISYTHLFFLLKNHKKQSLQQVWEIGQKLSVLPKSSYQNAETYWNTVDQVVASVVEKSIDDIKIYMQLEVSKTIALGQEGIQYWQFKIDNFQQLSKDEAIKLLIKAEKIEAKIKTIEKSIKIKI